MTCDVFVVAPVLMCELTVSVTFVYESENSQWEVVSDSPGRIIFLPGNQLFTVICPMTGQSPLMSAIHSNCL